jgi:hypothetical protein
MARIFDRRIALSKGGQIQYVVVGYFFRFICESLSRLHVGKTYHNILITLIVSGNGSHRFDQRYTCNKLFVILTYACPR